MGEQCRIGVYFNAKKRETLLSKLLESASSTVELIELDLDHPERYTDERLDIILLKPTVLMASSDGESQRRLRNLDIILEKHQDTPVVDPLYRIQKLTDRVRTVDLLRRHPIHVPGLPLLTFPETIHTTKFDIKSMLDDHACPLRFPLICKPVSACGPRSAHQMAIAPTLASLEGLLSDPANEFVLQEFINHSGVIYKAYSMGVVSLCEIRESIPDMPLDAHGDTLIHFNSRDSIQLNLFPTSSHESASNSTKRRMDSLLPDTVVDLISTRLRQMLQLSLFGFDLIISVAAETPRIYIVDINFFPSFKVDPDFPSHLLDFLVATAKAQ